jgi:predicted  nucleic acid-binding Zn-ribbon protein
MKQLISTTLFLLAFLSTTLNAQQISSDAYNKDVIHEDFNTEGEYFKIVTTTDNYFILDKGDYLLSRNNKDSEYAIIANNSSVTDFVIKTAVRIGPSENKKASVGIILKAQQDGKGAIIFEINKKREYRIKQLIGDSYQTLSGNAKQEGWVKNKLVHGVDEHNFIEIRSEKNIYDIYINSEYLTTFFIPDFTSGSCGLIISPATKARISYYYINTKGESTAVANYTNENTASVNETIEQLNKRIVILEENNAKLNELNTDSKTLQLDEIKALTAKNTSLANITTEQEKEITALTTAIENFKNTSNQSSATNKQLNKKISGLKQQISLEQATNTDLTNQINKINKSTNTQITQLTNQVKVNLSQVKTLKNKVTQLQTSNSTLSADLSTEKSAHKNTKSGISKSVRNKTTEINTLTADLNNAKEQLKTAISTLSGDLWSANTELSTLKTTQTKHDKVTADLNSKITVLSNQISTLELQLQTTKSEISVLEITNTELKALFIQKDFELNGVKASDMVKETTVYIPTPKNLKSNKVVYAVQLGMFMQTQSASVYKNLDAVWYQSNENGTYQYLSGEFSSPKEAADHQKAINAKGYSSAFVVTITK